MNSNIQGVYNIEKIVNVCDFCDEDKVAEYKCYFCGKDLCSYCSYHMYLGIDRYKDKNYNSNNEEKKSMIELGIGHCTLENKQSWNICPDCKEQLQDIITNIYDDLTEEKGNYYNNEHNYDELLERILEVIKEYGLVCSI
jgi:hypothetical protein